MFSSIFVFLTWLPPVLQGFCIALVSLFIVYVILRVLKLLWDILPVA